MDTVIKLCYRKIIDAQAAPAWERLIFEDSYAEFKMQAQRFNTNGQYSSFADILLNNAAAEQLHFLTSAAAAGYVKQLNNKMPDVQNTLGKTFLPFSNFKFEIINSDLNDKQKHKVAVLFYSKPVHWHCTIGNVMVLSIENLFENNEWLTETFILPAFVSIYSIKKTA